MLNILIVVVLGAAVAVAGSVDGARWNGVPVLVLCAALAFVIQWLAFIPAYLRQTERYYDLTGSATYLTVTALALALTPDPGQRGWVIGACIAVWALRLGSFLFRRISSDGSDSRFDRIKPNPQRFLFTWTLQGLWVVMTAACGLAAITASRDTTLGAVGWLGLLVWMVGFAVEVVADNQKRRFRARYGSERFIDSGLWRLSRHPNYFGEILLWSGVALMALPALAGWSLLTLVSPLFVFVLLTRVSGIPMLEKKGSKRWGDDPAYQRYCRQTPLLVPFLGRTG
jgi:steroid 5-alpha reductase family enzyme